MFVFAPMGLYPKSNVRDYPLFDKTFPLSFAMAPRKLARLSKSIEL